MFVSQYCRLDEIQKIRNLSNFKENRIKRITRIYNKHDKTKELNYADNFVHDQYCYSEF